MPTQARRSGRSIDPTHLKPRNCKEVDGQHYSPAAFPSGKDPAPIVRKVGWASGPICMDMENLAPYRVSIPEPSLYHLSYPGRH